jgi:DNA-directed RNA polymerase subunit RPC12/RpoP
MFGKQFRALKVKPETETKLESTILSESSDKDKTVIPSSPIVDSELLKSSSGRTANLIQEILKLDEIRIIPFFDYSNDQILYPILATIGESPSNTTFLDDLVVDGVLDKQIYEKLLVCPLHPNSISSTLRVHCPKCSSMNIDKLNLFEHKKCGHIIEHKTSSTKITSCPTCSKEIKDFEKDIKVLALWYKCDDCSEKFDDAALKIHCRAHKHDFDLTAGKLNNIFSYALKTIHVSKNSDSTQIKHELVKLLNGFNFITKQNDLVKGNSGNAYEIPICAVSPSNNDTLLIFIKNQFEGINESDMNSVLISKLDIYPTRTLFVTPSSVSDSVEKLAAHYGITLISDADFSKIISRFEEYISSWYSRNGARK